MKFTKDNLEDLAKIMDERLLKFHEEVTEPMTNNIVESLHEDMIKMESRLDERVAIVENNTYRIEKKLDNIADHHSERIDDHEKRVVRLEGRAVASL